VQDLRRLSRRIQVLSNVCGSIFMAKLFKQRRPIFVGLYIINRCNLRCSYCFANINNRFDDPAHSGLTTQDIIKTIDELYNMGTRWIFLLGGEPLLHKDIGFIVNHIVKKGILLHILTNGTLLEQKISEISGADGVCVSIDGAEEATDTMRGKGTFARALSGVEVALSHGMRTRIHAVLNKYSLKDMEKLAEMAKQIGVTITISPPNYLGNSDDPALQLTKDEYRDFYRRYRSLKEQGFPIGNSFYSIDKALYWPIDYYAFIAKKQRFSDYQPIPCVIGELHGCIDAEGVMFNCIQRGCLDGLNIKDVGIQKAWDELLRRRSDCVSCASVNTIETAAYLTLRHEIIGDGLRFFFKERQRK
jgi:MoaA/NifB/PqqE/SkfB family radical SAM enzyme